MATIQPRLGPSGPPAGHAPGRDAFDWPPSGDDLDGVSVCTLDGGAVEVVSALPACDTRAVRGASRRARGPRWRQLGTVSLVLIAGLLGLLGLPSRPRDEPVLVDRTTRASSRAAPGVRGPVPTPATRPARDDAAVASAPPVSAPPVGAMSPGARLDLSRRDRRDVASGPVIPEREEDARAVATAEPAVPDIAPLTSMPDGRAIALPVAPADGAALVARMTAPMTEGPLLSGEASRRSMVRPLIDAALDRYVSAYQGGDVVATLAVWPGVDVGALRRAFQSIRDQRLALSDCQIEVVGDSAVAACQGVMHYTPRVGSSTTRVVTGAWRIALARRADQWRITGVQAGDARP